jgi:hypothetical protein
LPRTVELRGPVLVLKRPAWASGPTAARALALAIVHRGSAKHVEDPASVAEERAGGEGGVVDILVPFENVSTTQPQAPARELAGSLCCDAVFAVGSQDLFEYEALVLEAAGV